MNIDLEQTVRERAYGICERECRVHGRHEEHWHAAKLELSMAAPDASSIAVPAASGGEPPKKSRRRAAPVEPPTPVASAPAPVASAPARRRRSPARPAQ